MSSCCLFQMACLSSYVRICPSSCTHGFTSNTHFSNRLLWYLRYSSCSSSFPSSFGPRFANRSASSSSKVFPVSRPLPFKASNISASFFGFYDIVEKLATALGTLIFGGIIQLTGEMRNSVLFLLILFVIGFALLTRIPSQKIYADR